MRPVPFNFTEHGQWMKNLAHCAFCEDTMGVVILDHGVPVACAIADSWCPNSAMVHVAVEDPRALRMLAREFFTYIFVTSGRSILLGTTPSTNKAALKLSKGMGFKDIAVIKDGYAAGVDFVLFRLNKADCRFIPQEIRLQEVA